MIFINFIILALFLILLFKTKDYDKSFVDKLDKKKYKLNYLFPAGLFVIDNIANIINHIGFSKQEESLKAIYIGESIKTVKRIYLCKKIIIFALIIFAFNLFSIFNYLTLSYKGDLQKDNLISRPFTSAEVKTIKLDVQITEDDLVVLTEEVDLEVQGRKYSKEEISELIIMAKTHIDSSILKDNKSKDQIGSDINLVEYIPDTDLYVAWELENYQLISRDGIVNNKEIEDKIPTWVKAVISYYDLEVEYKIDLTVLPKVFTKEEEVYRRLKEELEKVDLDSASEETLILPSSIDDMEVYWKEKEDRSSLQLLLVGLLAAVLVFAAYDKDLYDKVEERNRQMLLDYPEIINKVTLLLGAGMPMANAWHKVVQDYKSKKAGKRYAYEEMIITSNEILLGTSEITAYESFGRRVKLLPYLRFASLLSQNVKKGSGDLLRLLEIETMESLEERKELSKRIGEEAGTKLLFPMILMLLIVLIIIIIPAFLSFQF